jgi:hypothetical protein
MHSQTFPVDDSDHFLHNFPASVAPLRLPDRIRQDHDRFHRNTHMVSLISNLTENEQRELLDDLNYLNTAEIKSFCKKHSIP